MTKTIINPLKSMWGQSPNTTFFQKATILFKAINISVSALICTAMDVYRLVIDAKPERVMMWLDENI
ncbi:MAG: hypothetical protein ACI3Y5_09310 [Prevotella sp.]